MSNMWYNVTGAIQPGEVVVVKAPDTWDWDSLRTALSTVKAVDCETQLSLLGTCRSIDGLTMYVVKIHHPHPVAEMLYMAKKIALMQIVPFEQVAKPLIERLAAYPGVDIPTVNIYIEQHGLPPIPIRNGNEN